MDPTTFEEQLDCNRRAYEANKEFIRREYGSQWVALAGGQIVAAKSDIDGIYSAVAELVPVPDFFVIFPADSLPEFPHCPDDMSAERETAINCKGWNAIREQVRRDLPGQYVALAHGRIIASGRDAEEVQAIVSGLQPTPDDYCVFPADHEPLFQAFCTCDRRRFRG